MGDIPEVWGQQHLEDLLAMKNPINIPEPSNPQRKIKQYSLKDWIPVQGILRRAYNYKKFESNDGVDPEFARLSAGNLLDKAYFFSYIAFHAGTICSPFFAMKELL